MNQTGDAKYTSLSKIVPTNSLTASDWYQASPGRFSPDWNGTMVSRKPRKLGFQTGQTPASKMVVRYSQTDGEIQQTVCWILTPSLLALRQFDTTTFKWTRKRFHTTPTKSQTQARFLRTHISRNPPSSRAGDHLHKPWLFPKRRFAMGKNLINCRRRSEELQTRPQSYLSWFLTSSMILWCSGNQRAWRQNLFLKPTLDEHDTQRATGCPKSEDRRQCC